MSQTYQARRRAEAAPAVQTAQAGANGPSIQELAAGAQPTQEQMGSRVDLPGEIREKMESSFGADFSNVKLYESDTVAQAGAEAVTQGNSIAFAPGKLDLASTAGQALLGHELSHVVSQSRGESAGQGFLNDAGLEAQADRQGMMAAQGESVYQGAVSPIGTSSAMSAAGPMQAKKKKDIAQETLDTDKSSNEALRESERQMRKQHREYKNGPFGEYTMAKLAQAKDKNERNAILETFRDDSKLQDVGRQELIGLTEKLKASSASLTNEDFKTRASAFNDSTGLQRQVDALWQINPDVYLNEEESNAFKVAKRNFMGDRNLMRQSLDSAVGERSDLNAKQRKDYRRQRRKGVTAKQIISERARQEVEESNKRNRK